MQMPTGPAPSTARSWEWGCLKDICIVSEIIQVLDHRLSIDHRPPMVSSGYSLSHYKPAILQIPLMDCLVVKEFSLSILFIHWSRKLYIVRAVVVPMPWCCVLLVNHTDVVRNYVQLTILQIARGIFTPEFSIFLTATKQGIPIWY